MKKIITKSLAIIMSIIIVFSIVSGIIIGINILVKFNKEQLWAEANNIKLGEQDILYVDLTRKAEDIKKLNQPEVITQVSTNNESIVENINENAYNIEFKLDENKAIVDGNEVELRDILENIDENTSKDQICKYLSENIVGDIEYEGSNIKVINPYSTNKILVKTSNIEKIEEVDNIESITRISNDVYCVEYSNARATQKGYTALKNNNTIDTVAKDCKVSVLESNIDNLNIEALEVASGKRTKGFNDTGLTHYRNKINHIKNAPEIKVAVLDSGIRTTHEVFANQNTSDRLDLIYSYNYVGKNKNIADDYGHGTMVAGIIAEGTSNNVKIIPIKILDNEGNGVLSDVLIAMSALINKVDVINLSLGMDEKKISDSQKKACDSVLGSIYNSGIPIVCASGNKEEENVYYPASSSFTISVGAVDSEKQLASFSNYGDTLDFTAPGKFLTLPYYTADNLYTDDVTNLNVSNSGTSFASPFISSAIAMMKTDNKNYTVDQIKNILIENTEDLGPQGKDKYYGYGMLNLNTNMFSKPVIASFEINKNEDGTSDITVYAVCSNWITHWASTETEEVPTQWRKFPNGGNDVHPTVKTFTDKDCYVWIKDEKGNITHQKVYTHKTIPTSDPSTNNTTNTTSDPGTVQTEIMYGDLNNNNKIDIGDILILKRYIAQLNDKSVAQRHPDWNLKNDKIVLGDVNNNNKIDIGDILKLQRYIAAQNSAEVKAKHPDWAKLK